MSIKAVVLAPKPTPAPVVAFNQSEPLDLPEEMQGALQGWEEAPTWLNPVVSFTEPGHFFIGSLMSVRRDVGPNFSNLYEFADSRTGEVVSVWGGYVLDETFKLINPVRGTKVFMMFYGYRETKGGERKVKVFKIYTKAPGETA
jgi:hypothetical protein